MQRFDRLRGASTRYKRTDATLALAITAIALSAVGCRSKTIPSSSGGAGTAAAIDLRADPGTVYQVTFGDSTVLLDQATARRTLRSVSTNGNVFVFDSTPEIAHLAPGSVLVIRGATMRKVLAVMPYQGQIVLITAPAALTEAIRDAHIHFNHDVHFASRQASVGGVPSTQYAAVLPEVGM